MGRLSLSTNPAGWQKDWGYKGYRPVTNKPFRPYRTELALPDRMISSARNAGLKLHNIHLDGLHRAHGFLELQKNMPTPYQIGQSIRHIAAHAGPSIEKISLTPRLMGLQGPTIDLMRSDFEKALALNHGSAAEIWKNATIRQSHDEDGRAYINRESGFKTHFILDNQASLSEEDTTALYRSSLIIETFQPRFLGFLTLGGALRINIKDNLNRLTDIRPRSSLPVRSDVDLFARRTFALERQYLSWMHTIRPNWHAQITAGYLEEMYGGFGGEILYRPFDSRFAIGAESWLALKRDPLTDLNLGFTGDSLLTGHINLRYDLPAENLTLGLKAGRYLAEDVGAGLSLTKHFKNGTQLEAAVTISDADDFDLFGGRTHAYHAIRLRIPLGGVLGAPNNSRSDFTFAPFGRDIGQSLQAPLSLYEMTEPFSLRHLEARWDSILE